MCCCALVWASQGRSQCSINCASAINISIAGPEFGCEAEIRPRQLGVSFPAGCSLSVDVDLYTLQGALLAGRLDDQGHRIGLVTANHVGRQLQARVQDRATGNYCLSSIFIFDGQVPQISCRDTSVNMFCDITPGGADNFPSASVEDCSSISQSYQDSTVRYNCASSAYAKTYRTWLATDAYGARNTKRQVINLERIDLTAVVAPKDTLLNCEEGYSAGLNYGLPAVLVSGRRYNFPSLDGDLQDLFWYHADEVFQGAGARKEIIRTWRVFDDCAPLASGQNPVSIVQRISVRDTTAPTFIPLADTLFYSAAYNCELRPSFPQLEVLDDCSSTQVEMLVAGQLIRSNGGPGPVLGLGAYSLQYQVLDQAGNAASFTCTVVVRDLTPPVLITKPNVQVSLDNTGSAVVTPQQFDQGSYDECTELTWSIRRATDLDYVTHLIITCDDLLQAVEVFVRVEDDYGNTNTRHARVSARDLLPPSISTLPPLSISCGDTSSYSSNFQTPTIRDGCTITSTFSTATNLDDCGLGQLMRTWSAVDESGNMSTRSQTLTITPTAGFSESEISWPRDTLIDICTYSGQELGLPYVLTNDCARVSTAYTDEWLQPGSTSCAEVLREWILIDACRYNGSGEGEFRHVQRIKIIDTVGPVFAGPTALTLAVTPSTCDSAYLDIAPHLASDCHGPLTHQVQIDLNTDGSLDATLANLIRLHPLPQGQHTAHLTSSDACGNVAIHRLELDVIDTLSPTAVCVDTLIFPLSEGATFSASLLDQGSSSGCFAVPTVLATAFAPNCDSLGWRTASLVVGAYAGQQATCTSAVLVTDPSRLCQPPETGVEGAIATLHGAPPPTRIDLMSRNGELLEVYQSNSDGSFGLRYPLLDTAVAVPSSNYAVAAGVTGYDMYLIGQHVLGVSPLPLAAQVAADVNASGSLSAYDITLVRRLVLGLDAEFAAGGSYRFLRTEVLAAPDQTLRALRPARLEVIPGQVDTVALVAIKLGDVNVLSNLTRGVDARSQLGIDAQWMQRGSSWVLQLAQREGILLYGVTADLPAGVVRLSPKLQGSGLSAETEAGQRFNWYSNAGEALHEDDIVMLFTPDQQSERPPVLPQLTMVASLDAGAEQVAEYNVRLSHTLYSVPDADAAIVVQPNPVRAGGALRLSGQTAVAQLELFDGRGSRVQLLVIGGEAAVDMPTDLAPGMYYLRLKLSNGQFREHRLAVIK